MSEEEEDQSFYLNKNACSLSTEDDFLIITLLQNEKAKNEEKTVSRTIPIAEILSVTCVNETPVENRKFSLRKNAKLPALLIQTIKRAKDHRWRLIIVKLKTESVSLCERWTVEINEKLTPHKAHRPQSLLVFINPCGGRRIAKEVYNKKARPIFEAASVKTHVVITTHRNHSRNYIEHEDLSTYDGIIAVGGDGMLNEVVNGLLCLTQSKNSVPVHAKKGCPRESPKYVRPEIRLGVIPAGSTDCVSYVTNGINDAETAALHIVLGDSHPVDVTSLHDSDGLLKQFSMSLTGYGFYGDMLRRSEGFRWMGPPRYSYVGVNTFLLNKSYSGEIHYLPAKCSEGPKSSSFCRSPCNICQDGFEEVQTPLFTPITPNGSFFTSVETAPASLSPEYQMTDKSTTSDSSMDGLNDLGEEELLGRGVITSASDSALVFHASIDGATPPVPHGIDTPSDYMKDDIPPGTPDSMLVDATIPLDVTPTGISPHTTPDGAMPPDATAISPSDGISEANTSTPADLEDVFLTFEDNDAMPQVATLQGATPQDDVSQDAATPHREARPQIMDIFAKKHTSDGDTERRQYSPVVRPGSLSVIKPEELGNSNSTETEEEWKVLKGEFIVVNGVPISCACERVPLGMSPASHLSDGALDLITVRACSRFEFLRYLLAHVDKADRFAFPFVEVRRVKAFQYIPSSIPSKSMSRQVSESPNTEEEVQISFDDLRVQYNRSSKKKKSKKSEKGTKRSQSMYNMELSTWNSDGEVVKEANITVRVHRGLIVMFCRGVENIA